MTGNLKWEQQFSWDNHCSHHSIAAESQCCSHVFVFVFGYEVLRHPSAAQFREQQVSHDIFMDSRFFLHFSEAILRWGQWGSLWMMRRALTNVTRWFHYQSEDFYGTRLYIVVISITNLVFLMLRSSWNFTVYFAINFSK